eukprot:423132_1
MMVNCNGLITCRDATINGGDGNLMINGYGDWYNMYGINVICPSEQFCNITCSEYGGCAYANIKSQSGTKLNIHAYGDEQVLYVANITCPLDAIRGENANQCNIIVEGDGTYDNVMTQLNIYAVEAFKDVNIICNNNGISCFDDQLGIRPRIHCTEDFGEFGEFVYDTAVTSWKCVENIRFMNGIFNFSEYS